MANIKTSYTDGARRGFFRMGVVLARMGVTADWLTIFGLLLQVAGLPLIISGHFGWALIIGIIASVCDALDGAVARAGVGSTKAGAFLDSTTDRVSEGFMLTAIAYLLATQHRPVFVAVTVAAIAGSFLVSYTRAKAEAIGLRGDVGIGSRAERVVVITAGLVLAPWGVLPWAIALLACTAWITVCQRVLHVRKQLMEANT